MNFYNNLRTKNPFKTIFILIVFVLSSMLFISSSFASTENVSITDKTETIEVYTIEKVAEEVFGESDIEKSELLYNLDGSADYIYVEFTGGGYAIFFKQNMEPLEYSAQGKRYCNYETSKVLRWS